MKQFAIRMVLAALAVTAVAVGADARTQTFLETNQTQFKGGESDAVVSTNLGVLRLGRALDDLLAETAGVDYVASCAEAPDGAIYAVTGGGGRIYRAKDGKVALYATLDDPYLFCVVVDKNGDLYVGSGGGKGRIWHVSPPKGDQKTPQARVLFASDEVAYIWDLAWLADGALAAATGDQGQLLRVTRGGEHQVLIDSEADHVLCLAVAPDGTLYAGTDGEAIVYRWANGKPFILHDAEENEVTALTTDADGNLYVGTSSGKAGRTGGTTIRVVQPPPQQPNAPGKPEGNAVDNATKSDGGNNDNGGADTKPAGAATPASTAMAEATKLANSIQAARKAKSGAAAAPGAATGASVLRITPDGLATPIFDTDEAMILALAVAGDRLLIGTGNPARLYEVTLARDGEEQARLASVDPKQVMAITVTKAGHPIVATAGPGRLYTLSDGYAKEGTYTSQVYDASGSAQWGALTWRGQTPAGTAVRLTTRTGNVRDPEKGLWSDWSKPLAKSPATVPSPAARYIQFRVSMTTNRPAVTPVLEQFEAAYLRANEPPRILRISEIAVGDKQTRAQAIERFRQAVKKRTQSTSTKGSPPRPPAPQGSQPFRMLRWQAEDPNGDTLRYGLWFRGQGETTWILLDDNLAVAEYAWDTAGIADGWYELKVTASDRPDRPADAARTDQRISDPILIDNTAPVIENVVAKVEKHQGRGRAIITFTARDAASRIDEAAYTVDTAADWHAIAPADRLFDTDRETFRVVVDGLESGAHRIGIRVVDEANNRGHAAVTVVAK